MGFCKCEESEYTIFGKVRKWRLNISPNVPLKFRDPTPATGSVLDSLNAYSAARHKTQVYYLEAEWIWNNAIFP